MPYKYSLIYYYYINNQYFVILQVLNLCLVAPKHPNSHVQIGNCQRILFNKVTSRFNLVAHQGSEYVI